MILDTLYVRFFRSFNYDYLRKGHENAKPDAWDDFRGLFYPYIKVRMERGITTVVGANESGKSQLLTAIKSLLNGSNIEPKDFCRYSRFFAVDKAMAKPEFGGRFTHLTNEERETIRSVFEIDFEIEIEDFYFFRRNEGNFIYLSSDPDGKNRKIDPAQLKKLNLPTYFEIDANTPLPDSVPIEYLVSGKNKPHLNSRAKMLRSHEALRSNLSDIIGSDAQKQQALGGKLAAAYTLDGADDAERDLGSRLKLAETLLIRVAEIDRSAFSQLQEAVKTSEGYANGLVERINQQLSEKLNFSKWWSQDRDFGVYLTLRDFDLVLTVKDRTGSDYSFSERSDGMKYFLSYFVQYLAYQPSSKFEILLMDEPDRFLSTSGQQDLLRLFSQFATPDDPKRQGVQVVYVTHSPFLIDKNHSDRIRVLEKGDGDEGTRVVRNVGQNHYEPLRSAFGAFVAETTFIGSCNLMMEGQADQILLAGISTLIREKYSQKESLDLNTLTLVPSGSAEHIPYMVYLARGRDVEKPALVVLLDGDNAGENIRKELKKGYRGRKIIDDDFILSTRDIRSEVNTATKDVQEIEDLIPIELAAAALKIAAAEVFSKDEFKSAISKFEEIQLDENEKIFTATARAAQALMTQSGHYLRLDKVAFARAIVEAMRNNAAGTEQAVLNFSSLFSAINLKQRSSMRKNAKERTTLLLKRMRTAFLLDHPHSATKVEVQDFLENVEAQIADITDENEAIRNVIRLIRNEHQLNIEPRSAVTQYPALRERIESMTYEGIRQAQRPDGLTDFMR